MQARREQFDCEDSLEERIQELEQQVDELMAANLLLQEQLARKEQFLAMIAHELRGPLTPIISYAQRLARHVRVDEVGAEAEGKHNENIPRSTSVIISQARRLSRLVNDLLDASRLTSGQFTLMREECDIVALTRESVEYLRPVAPYHTLVVEAPAGPIVGNWDAGRLQQALGNLLDNAIKYSDEMTVVTVRIWTVEGAEGSVDMTGRVHVSVHNEGVSIPSAEVGLLFRPYTRLPATSMREGSGLGLYITKSIIDAHGGELHLEPNTQEATSSQGTTFSFSI